MGFCKNLLERLVSSVAFSLKNFLLLLNFIAAVAGIVLTFTCIYLIKTRTYGLNAADASFLDPLIMFGIVIGAAICLVSVLGLCGAANDGNGLIALKTYAILVGVLILVQIIFGGVAYLKRDQLPRLIENSWTSAALNDSSVVSQIEIMFSCCGWKATNDSSAVPSNCVALYPQRNKPCFNAIEVAIADHLDTIGGIGVGLGIIELLGVIFSVAFMHIVRKKMETNTYFVLDDSLEAPSPQEARLDVK